MNAEVTVNISQDTKDFLTHWSYLLLGGVACLLIVAALVRK